MKDQWYGDNRDIVKWAVLLHLARQYDAKRIIQVAYFRSTEWKSLIIDRKKKDIPIEVLRHFRRVRNITKMVIEPNINIIDSIFSDRNIYMGKIIKDIKRYNGIRTIVFLDPDTGLEPKKPKLEHVLEAELREIWQKMHKEDLLVFYQHQTNKNGKEWIKPKHRQFQASIGAEKGAVKIAKAPDIARDVVFFYCQKKG
jgi:hypothetical protein